MEDSGFYSQRIKLAEILSTIDDPELHGISIIDLGMVIAIDHSDGKWKIGLAPTYMGCPAIDVIPILAKTAFEQSGFSDTIVEMKLTPPWSTDWISDRGRIKLKENLIAPPSPGALQGAPAECPRCQSTDLTLISRHGSTACKSMYVCQSCLEPFEYFKCH